MATPRFRRCDFEKPGAQLTLALPGSRRRAVEAVPAEAEVQEAIVTAARLSRFEVLETTRRRQRETCPRCHFRFFPQQGDGCDIGIPDLMVRARENPPHRRGRPGWHPYSWAGLEVKAPGGEFSNDKQRELAADGSIAVVHSWAEAEAVLLEADEWLKAGGG